MFIDFAVWIRPAIYNISINLKDGKHPDNRLIWYGEKIMKLRSWLEWITSLNSIFKVFSIFGRASLNS